MKLILLLFLIALEVSIINTSSQINSKKLSDKFSLVNRKTSINSETPLMLVGFWNYSQTIETSELLPITFNVHFINETSSHFYQYLNMSITITTKNLTTSQNVNEDYNISCNNPKISHKTNALKDISYNCLVNVSAVALVAKPKIQFLFYNNSAKSYYCAEDKIDKSSLAEETIYNIIDNKKDINYDVFDLQEIELKGNEFTLKGDFSQSYETKKIDLNISGIIYNYSITNDSIKFNATGIINDHLHGKMPESNDGTRLLFYANSIVDDSLNYPISNEYIEVVGFGNYKPATTTADATNQLVFTGTQYLLNELKRHVRFNVKIKYNSLRILEESTQTITAIGTKIGKGDQKDDFVVYNVNYPNTAKRNIISMSIPSSFEFTNDNQTYTKIDENIFIPSDLNLTNTENVTVERIEYLSLPDTSTSNSLAFDFNVSKLNLRDDKVASLSYYPFNRGDRKEIKCYIENKTLPYRMTCSPKQYIYTQMNTLKFIIPEIKSSSRRLRSLSTETNRTLFTPTNYSGIMEYEYNPTGNVFSRKTASNGLSAGAIVAIVLATVAAVACVALAFFFLNRVKVTPPPIKTPTDVIFANTSTNINH